MRKHAFSAFGSIDRLPIRSAVHGARPGDPDLVRIFSLTLRVGSDCCDSAELRGRHKTLVRIDGAEALHNPQAATGDPGDVHVGADMMLSRHHFSGAARTFVDAGTIERVNHRVLTQRACRGYGSLPQLHAAI